MQDRFGRCLPKPVSPFFPWRPRFLEVGSNSNAGFRDQLLALEKCLDLAETLKAPLVRCFSFMRSGNLAENLSQLLEITWAKLQIWPKSTGLHLVYKMMCKLFQALERVTEANPAQGWQSLSEINLGCLRCFV